MRLVNDDDIYRYEGELLDMRGTETPIHPRYKVIGIFAGSLPFWIIVLRLFGADPMSFVLFGVTFAVVTAMYASLYITSEHTLKGRLATVRTEWTAARLAYARARCPRPVVIRFTPPMKVLTKVEDVK